MGVTTCEYKKTDNWKNVDITSYEFYVKFD